MTKAKRKSANELPSEVVERIRGDIARWQAGLWAEEVSPEPACICGKQSHRWIAAGGGVPTNVCARHPKEE